MMLQTASFQPVFSLPVNTVSQMFIPPVGKCSQSEPPHSHSVHFAKNALPSKKELFTKALCLAEDGLDMLTSRRANVAALLIQVFGGFGGSLLANQIDFHRNPVSLTMAPYCVNSATKAMIEPEKILEKSIVCPKGSVPGKNSFKTTPNQGFGTSVWDVPEPAYRFLHQFKEHCGASGGGPLTYIVGLDLTKDKVKKILTDLRKKLNSSSA